MSKTLLFSLVLFLAFRIFQIYHKSFCTIVRPLLSILSAGGVTQGRLCLRGGLLGDVSWEGNSNSEESWGSIPQSLQKAALWKLSL